MLSARVSFGNQGLSLDFAEPSVFERRSARTPYRPGGGGGGGRGGRGGGGFGFLCGDRAALNINLCIAVTDCHFLVWLSAT